MRGAVQRWSGWSALGVALLLSLPALAGEAQDLLEAGLQQLEAGNSAAAMQLFGRLADAEPEEPLAHYYLGLAAADQGRDVLAASAFSRAAELEPELPWVQANLGITLFRLGELDAAEDHLLEAMLQGPDDADVLLHLGMIDAVRGQPDRAIRLFDEAAALDPELAARAHLEAAQVELDRGNEEAAIAALELAVAAPGPSSSREAAAELLTALEGGAAALRRIALRGSVGVEYDDNVTVSEQDLTTGVPDVAGVFGAGIDLFAIRSAETALYAGYDFYQSIYAELGSFDLQSHSPHLAFETRIGRFRPRVAYGYTTSTLGGLDFIDRHRIDLESEARLAGAWYGTLGVRMERLDFAETPARDAKRISIPMATRLALRNDRLVLRMGWKPEWQEARGRQFSYMSHVLGADASLRLPVGDRLVTLNASYDYTHKDFTSITPSIRRRRRDRLHYATAGLALPIVPYLEALLDYVHVSSSSNLPELNYSQNIVTLRLSAWY